MFGGDQMDPDYAPHLYDVKGEFVGEPDADDQAERKVPRRAPAAGPPTAGVPETDAVDKRVRSIVGDYRVVVPDGRQKGSKFYVNNSPVVIERRGRDARGVEKWDRVTSFSKPGPKGGDTEIDHALYWLLAGSDAE
jgi:hypothetical protein